MVQIGIGGLHAVRQRTTTSYEQVPMDYYDEEALETRMKKADFDTELWGNVLRGLKKGKSYLEEVETTLPGNISYNIRFVKGKVIERDKTSIIERILLSNGGEIELIVTKGILYACSRKYAGTEYTTVTRSISKRIMPGLTEKQTLENAAKAWRDARTAIFDRLTKLEMNLRKQENYRGLVNYHIEPAPTLEVLKKVSEPKQGKETATILSPEILEKAMAALDRKVGEKRQKPASSETGINESDFIADPAVKKAYLLQRAIEAEIKRKKVEAGAA